MFTMETRHQFHQKFQRFRQLLLDAPENMEYVHLVMDQTSDSLCLFIALMSIGCSAILSRDDSIDSLILENARPIHIIIPSSSTNNKHTASTILVSHEQEFTILSTGFKVNGLASLKGPNVGCLTSSSTNIDPKITIGAFLGTMTQSLYISKLLEMTSNDVSYIHTSIGFTYALRNSIASIIGGCQIVLFGNGEIRDDIHAPSPTILFGVIPIYKWFMEADHGLGFNLSGLRYAFSGGIVLPGELRRSIYERYGFHIYQNYGTTETGMISLDIYPNIEKYSSNRIYVYKTSALPLS
eukprot:gene12162-14236_t